MKINKLINLERGGIATVGTKRGQGPSKHKPSEKDEALHLD